MHPCWDIDEQSWSSVDTQKYDVPFDTKYQYGSSSSSEFLQRVGWRL